MSCLVFVIKSEKGFKGPGHCFSLGDDEQQETSCGKPDTADVLLEQELY